MSNTIRYNPAKDSYSHVVVKSKVTHFTKSDDGELTYIHLDNKEKLESVDSINTLEARLNSED